MPRRGRCRCGHILVFHRGPQGYKTRCPRCLAIVRLHINPPAKPRPSLNPTPGQPFDAAAFAAAQFLEMDEQEDQPPDL